MFIAAILGWTRYDEAGIDFTCHALLIVGLED